VPVLPDVHSSHHGIFFMAEAPTAELRLTGACYGEQAENLKTQILELRGQDIVIDAEGVTGIDTPNLEVLIAAARLWKRDEKAMTIAGQTSDFRDAIAGLQIELTDFESKGTDDA